MRAANTVLGISLKMYLDSQQTVDWAVAVAELARNHRAISSGTVALFVLPTFQALPLTIAAFAKTAVAVGAQDLFWEDSGPFTGEVSGADLYRIGCRYVAIGHIERRRLFGETDRVVARKIAAAFRNRLSPVVCVGEATPQRVDVALAHCLRQLCSALSLIRNSADQHFPADPHSQRPPATDAGQHLVVAYEPGWAIGSTAPAPAAHIRFVCEGIRGWLTTTYPELTVKVIYGGSAGSGQLAELDASVDGLFLGRAAHQPAELAAIVSEADVRLRC
jgi:triosephosphate isomerase